MRGLCLVLVALCAGCAGTRMSSDVLDLARSTKSAGSFHVEYGQDGRMIEAGADVMLETVPANCRAAADVAYPGGSQTGAERIRTPDRSLWMVTKKIDGRAIEILVGEDGTIQGAEEVLDESAWPAPVVAAAKAAVPGASLERVERVSGAEAQGAEVFHVKFDLEGDSIRVGLTADAKVVRVVRRVQSQVRVPR